jgi:transposase
LASLKPKPAADPLIRFETKPGEPMQVDWAVIRVG